MKRNIKLLHRTYIIGLIMGYLNASAIALANPVEGYTPPQGLIPRSSSEYYSTAPNAQLLLPVNIWGEVREPGVHYVLPGSSALQSISVAGGPLPSASMPEVKIISKSGQIRYVDLIAASAHLPVNADDTIIIDRSFKQDLPLIFSGLTVAISIATLFFVTSNKD